MKITVIGCGAMGGLYSAYLSQNNDVTVLDVMQGTVDRINEVGLEVEEPDGSRRLYHPRAATTAEGMGPQDLVIVFVKATFTESALDGDRNLIGPDTYLMTLQNGGGHEDILSPFANRAHVVIGTTQHNAAHVGDGRVRHGGSGPTVIGVCEGTPKRLRPIVDAFNDAGIETGTDDNIQRLIWNKVFTNVSASALTGIFQMPLGFIAQDEHAWALCTQLVHEAVAVANALGFDFSPDEKLSEVRHVCEASPNGITSIQADIAAGRRTEVDTITGFVVKASRQCGVDAPSHEFVQNAVHALEGRARALKQHKA